MLRNRNTKPASDYLHSWGKLKKGEAGMEKRRLERFDLQLPATIEIIGDNGDHEARFINLLTRNACSGGAYFHTNQPLPVGTEVKIDLVLSIDSLKKIKGKHAFIQVNGSVIRTEANGMAICFDSNYSIKPVSSR